MVENKIKPMFVSELFLQNIIHTKIIKTLDLNYSKIPTELSNDLFEKAEKLNEEINCLIQEEIDNIQEDEDLMMEINKWTGK